jgi:hypothetical protein
VPCGVGAGYIVWRALPPLHGMHQYERVEQILDGWTFTPLPPLLPNCLYITRSHV